MRDAILWASVAMLVSCTAFRDHSPGGDDGGADGSLRRVQDARLAPTSDAAGSPVDAAEADAGADPGADAGVLDAAPDGPVADAVVPDGAGADVGDAAVDARDGSADADATEPDASDGSTDAHNAIPEGGLEE